LAFALELVGLKYFLYHQRPKLDGLTDLLRQPQPTNANMMNPPMAPLPLPPFPSPTLTLKFNHAEQMPPFQTPSTTASALAPDGLKPSWHLQLDGLPIPQLSPP
jgi:hypothetical protein